MTRLKNLLIKLIFIIPILFAVSCGEELGVSSQRNSNVPLKINIVAPESAEQTRTDFTTAQLEDFIEFVETVRVTVSDGFPTFTRSFSVGETVLLFVPPGENITFIVALLNSEGQSICSGQVTTDIIPGIQNEITIECEVNDEICDNGTDDNGNGLTDCEENACAGSECDETNTNICIDNVCVTPPAEENVCDDGIDNDFDTGMPNGGTDCEDLDCADDPACIETICDDGIDNDGDDGEENGGIDCEDIDCADDSACDEICDNMEDDDNDGDIDCADDECNNQNCDAEDVNFVCVEGLCEDTGGETDCDNGQDDDDDGFTDCDDLDDCEGRVCFGGDSGSACVVVQGEGGPFGECQEVICSDGINNDNDDLFEQFPAADCDDEDCEGELCGTGSGAVCNFFGEGGECLETNCFDGIDNNQNESTDCSDFNCYNNNLPCGNGPGGQGAECQFNGESGECVETNCSNSLDDDGDESVDCNDFDCNEDPSCLDCSVNCGADQQNPDGNPACEGMSCGSGVECQPNDGPLDCVEAVCNDGIDNDLNQQTDCQDFFCDGQVGGPQGQLCEEFFEQTCDDGFDNDADGDVDGADTDCQF